MDVADSDHGHARFDASFVVLAVATTAAVPGIRTLHHPPFLQRGEPVRALGTLFDLDPPTRTMCFQPGLQFMVVILVVPEIDRQAREASRRDLCREFRLGDAGVDS